MRASYFNLSGLWLFVLFPKIQTGKNAMVYCGDVHYFGGITLIFSDVTYIKMKAVIINIGIGIGFLVTPLFNKERMPIIQKLLGSLLELSPQGWMRLNWAWCGQFFLLASLHFFFGFIFMQGKYWGEFTAFGDIIVSISYLAVILFCLRKHFKTTD